MRKLVGGIVGLAISVFAAGSSFAINTLQLDIAGGTYYAEKGAGTYNETTVSNGPVFDLEAYLMPDSKNTLTDTYYISIAVMPKVGPADVDLGSLTFDGMTIDVTADMVYGVPPIELAETAAHDGGDLGQHSIYETYFYEFEFSFSGSGTVSAYNTATGQMAPGFMNAMTFAVDTTNLNDGVEVHFDLYNTKIKCGDVDVTQFAPFSHDAQSNSNQVPEPGTLLLLGTGLLGLGLMRRKK